MPSSRPCSSFVHGARVEPWRIEETIVAATFGGIGTPLVHAVLRSFESASPATYSMTMKISPSTETTSSVGTTFGWRMRRETRFVEEHRDESGSFAN